ALAGGLAADTAHVAHVASVPDQFGRVLLACVEPVELSPRGMELAGVALRAIAETFAATAGTPAEALGAAFAAANVAVMAENRPLATGRWERRICVGASAVALAGREIVVAQAAPSQAILVQDGQVYAFPDVASWRGDYAADASFVESHPLGSSNEQTPRLFCSEAVPGDLIVLAATSLGRALVQDERAIVDLYGGALLTADLEGSVDRLERLLAEHDIAEAFAIVASVSRLPGRSRLRPRLQPRLARRAKPPAASSAVGTDAGVPALVQADSVVPTTASAEIPTPMLPAFDERPPLFEGLRDWAIDLAELFSGSRQQRTTAYDARRTALAAPGALSVRRYRESPGLPPEWRANLPRGPSVHVPVRLLAVSLFLFIAVGGTGFALDQQRDREARAGAALVAIDTALMRARENPGTAMTSVAEAEAAVAEARDAGATGDALVRREQELARVRDDVWGILRLADVMRVGSLPPAASEESVHLALVGETLYLAAGSLYELDPEQGRLVTLLAHGDAVAGGSAGDIRHVSIDGGRLVVSDGAATYVRDKSGRWQRRPLAVADVDGLRPDAPVIVWGDAAYALSREGNLVRFDQESGNLPADTWAAAEDVPDLVNARDFAIDGRIHVLVEDGRTLTFSRGALIGTVSPFVVPALTDAAFLAHAPFANDFYIVDRNGAIGENVGRIVRTDASGEARQYLTPAPAPGDLEGHAAAVTLAHAEDLAIDELSRVVYWVSDGEIWRATMPLDPF
ncbi:MAG: hypothetical protein K0S99_2593, partial [Thermomicrobiales bacterium]|nr:hypothetical protein [Thermomicrobiales bacterium]